VELMARLLRNGERPPSTVMHSATSFPAHTELTPIAELAPVSR
jgi:hypothetical protein